MARTTASYLEPKTYHLPRTEALLSYLSSKYHGAYAHVASCVEGTDIASYFRLAREYAGSAWSINFCLLLVEFTGVIRNLIPTVQVFDFSRFRLWLFKSPLTAVYTFDPAFFFTKLFWGVGSLWLVIGVLVPLMFAYVFNPSVGANLSSAGGSVGPHG
ncbi:hypothetical protein KEM56_005167 [Ascosphaera pollenicola]|nr:hypothetical protein KEM56_005167 [Ascosphaera pollenicola]